MLESSQKAVRVAFGLALLILAGAGIIFHRTATRFVQVEGWMAHTHEVLATLEALLSDISAAESAERGYILTGDAQLLEPYRGAIEAIPAKIDALRRLTAGNPRQQQRLNALEPLTERRLSLLKESVDLQKSRVSDASRQIALTEEGGLLMVKIRAAIQEMEGEERRLLQTRTQESRTRYRFAMAFLAAGGLVGLTLLLAASHLINQEIMERRRAEQTLRESEESLRLLIEGVKDYGICMLDPDGRVVSWNAGAERIKGYREEEILGRHFSCFYPQEDVEHGKPEKELRVAATEGRCEEEGVRVRKDGSQFWADDVITALRDKEGRLRGFAKVTRDITERRRAEEALAQKVAELARSNAELEQFAYMASHDLQEPLRMVASYTQLLAKRYRGKLDADADDFITFAVDGATWMQTLITDLLTYSRVGTRGKPFAPADSEAVFDRVLSSLKVAMDESGAVVTHDPLPTVMGDAVQLGQLFQNLLVNAIKFRGEKPPRVHVSARRNGNAWRFSVRDNGIGIAPEHAERIFLLFQRLHTKAEYQGTGIGLALCKKIVERHDGRIWVESQPQRGATFHFVIPAANAKP